MGKRLSLGQFIASRRKYKGYTQEQLADNIGVSKSAVAKWETDGGLPDRDNLKRIAEVLNVSVDDLHKIIGHLQAKDDDLNINITPEVIATLESYGYKVIRPGESDNDGGKK